MVGRNYFQEKILLPIGDFITGNSVKGSFDFLQKSQYWSFSELESYQNLKLNSLIIHAYKHVPYYRELFEKNNLHPQDIRTRDDLYKIPILRKSHIRENKSKFVASNIKNLSVIKTGSSGSTGEPLHYLINKDAYSFNIAANLRGWYWMGYELGDKYIKLSQNPRKSFIKKAQDFLSANKYLYSQQLTSGNLERIIDEIIEYQPKVLRGYPDPLFFLAKYAKKNSINSVNVPLITTTGNILFPEARNLIETQFHGQIFDSYSCEGGTCFFESSQKGFYYGAMEYGITEIINNEGDFVDYGESGRHITTDLHNYAMPFIRYDTQDHITRENSNILSKKEKALFAIESIQGRESDILITPKGKYLIVHNFTGFFQQKTLDCINMFQVKQPSHSEIDIFIEVNKDFNKDIENYIFDYWNNYISDEMNIRIIVTDKIEPSPSGKRRFLIRDSSVKLEY